MSAPAADLMAGLDELVEVFELLGDWDQRYQYLVEMGEALPPMPAGLKVEENQVRGCMSQVWVRAYAGPPGDGIRFHGDSDTAVIKGILALLIQLVAGRSAAEVQALDLDAFFARLHLDEHLSPNRHVGVYAMAELMKRQAAALPPAAEGDAN